MDFQEILIVAIGSFALFIGMPAVIGFSDYKIKKLKLERDLVQAGGHEMRAELDQLRQRVRVLERLATDGDRKLAGEIERLRREETTAGI